MSLLSPQVWLRIAVIAAMVIGLLRPPFGSEDHDRHEAPSLVAMLHGEESSVCSHDVAHRANETGAPGVSDCDHHGERHDSGDHSHVATNLPPVVADLTFPPFRSSLVVSAASVSRTAAFSLERPPKLLLFA